jgi:hypothetical protein
MPEAPKEPWITWVALTTTFLAVLAAIASLRAFNYFTQVQIATTREANQWSYYQANSLKEHSYSLNRDLLAAIRLLDNKNPKFQKYLTDRIKEYEGEISRYDKEKHGIEKGAEELIKEQEGYKRKSADFALTVMVLQIAIMCSAVGALIKKKIMWLLGLILGGWGIFYFVMGFIR